MGKGDRKTRKGKRYNSSYGNSRPRRRASATGEATQATAAAGRKSVVKPAKKVVAQKTVVKE
ncbi:MAG: 30S ribosomal protein THX [Gammaproteobacteria bacterium]|nr:30S ribosomal protein THX [Gammaproteobacteria bacterium]